MEKRYKYVIRYLSRDLIYQKTIRYELLNFLYTSVVGVIEETKDISESYLVFETFFLKQDDAFKTT